MKARELFYGFLFSLILVLATANNAVADTPVSGLITTDTTWTLAGSPYIVIGGVLVNSGVTLTIEPGVVVKFDSGLALQINGQLIARGIDGNMVTFTSNQTTPAAGDWGYILFSDSSTDATYDIDGNYTGGSILEYCVVEYAGGVSVTNNGAVRMDGAHPFIDYCTIQNNSASGIHAWNLSENLKITNGTVASNSGGGIYIFGGTVTISNNRVSDNTVSDRGGGICIGAGAFYISDNTIENNTASNYGGGVNLGFGTAMPTGTITNNTISNNTAQYGGGISAGWIGGTISNNIISNNTASSDGGGLHIIYAIYSNAAISNNIISGNSASSSGGVHINYSITTVSNNIISDNTASAHIGGILFGHPWGSNSSWQNTITGNISPDTAVSIAGTNQDFRYSVIRGNVATGAAPTYTVYIEESYLFNNNNIFENTATYELWNNSAHGSTDVNAADSWWGTAIESEIQAKIYDWFDDSSRGIVNYYPFETAIRTDAPISPPTGLSVSTTDTDIIMSWDANPESDVAGYKVYWDTQGAPFFENVVDVGNSLGHTITGLAADTYYVAVTAYDTGYAGANDDPDTIVNENQTNGNESWYTSTVAFVGVPELTRLTLVDPNGGERLVAAQTHTISWQSEGPIDDVLIEYSTNNGFDWVPIGTVVNTGSYPWLVPTVTSGQCLVRISDASNLAVSDTSDDVFTIFVCQPPFAGDIDGNCYVDWVDFSIFAEDWLKCGNLLDPNCVP